ncbi:DNA ligase D [Zobellia galactanivorans]|uniref:DNA ligase D n=1 Tax=Zobellia galactanivorans (strain DSM 12802 / CCUG 47099 / CIP 106680 / NCIMB 13871 / Dsij) TaxID=63186 RepID=UPI0026E2C630|nr:DNA ligase D [Zobellia galactanivorans]MDO6811140.1 DNA ligase D [Zobellia galactanivorans]
MSLKKYSDKRNFDNTPEPKGELQPVSKNQRFVIQRHAARRLHYDLRLEINGALKSWAIPKGPSMNANDKRLAVRTEDHPLEYLTFHGTIPKGNYGAGNMIIWDTGTFEVDRTETDKELTEQLAVGTIKLIFYGNKIRGRFALVLTTSKNDSEQWLLIKKKDDFAITTFYDAESLVPVTETRKKKFSSKLSPGSIIQPMLASNSKEIFNDPNFIYELKWDGYRVISHITDGKVLLQSRNGINYNSKFSKLHDELAAIEHDVILDGEIVLVDSDGVSQFSELQNYPNSNGELRYYVFDMLFLNGHGMLDLKLTERKSLINEIIGGLTITQYCDHIEGMGTALFNKALEAGMEGVMAKEKKSNYVVGFRTEKWLKIKGIQSTDAIICGYTESNNGPEFIGSLILGQHVDNDLKYIGNCGTGFTDKSRRELQMLLSNYEIEERTFKKKIPLKGRIPHWIQPILECEVTYSERTKNGLLRNPVLKRIKTEIPKTHTDKNAPTIQTKKSSSSKEVITIDGFKVPISNLDKIYWPQSKLTKYDLIDYYLNISEYILPHLIDRPQNLHRHPNGIDQESFYQKDNEHLPEWFETVSVYSKSSEREINYLLCQNTASLIYLANLGCIEINPWSSRIKNLDQPDYGIIDLDPPENMDFKHVVTVANEFHKILNDLHIQSFCKVSGSKGIHIYLPMSQKYSYVEVRNFIKLLCHLVEERLPTLTTLERTINKRRGKIYLDYLQNRRGHTIASVHSVRPIRKAPISAPIHWDELNGKLEPRKFLMNDYGKRLKSEGDLFYKIIGSDFDMQKALSKIDLIN